MTARKFIPVALIAAAATALALHSPADSGASVPPPPASFAIQMASVNSQEAHANGENYQPFLSRNGRYLAFQSDATNLDGDTDEDGPVSDVFLRDLVSGTTELISRDSSGADGDDSSLDPSVSDNQVAAFSTYDRSIAGLPGDGALPFGHIVVREMNTGQTELVNVSSSGTPANAHASDPVISADGRYVAFVSPADNLTANDAALCNGSSCNDIFRHDRVTGETEMASVSTNGAPGNNHSFTPAVSADGSRVVFQTAASNLAANDTKMTCDLNFDGVSNEQCVDVFMHDFNTGTTTLVSAGGNGHSSSGSISADGRYVAFQSEASNLSPDDDNDVCDNDFDLQEDDNCSDVFIRDTLTNQTTLVTHATGGGTPNENSGDPAVSADGNLIAFYSRATDMVPGYACTAQPAGFGGNYCQDIYIYDREAQETRQVTVGLDGFGGNDASREPQISDSGAVIAFHSYATNLAPNDNARCGLSNERNCGDIFAASPLGPTYRADVNCDGVVDPNDALTLTLDSGGVDATAAGCPEIGSPFAQPASGPAGSQYVFGDADCNTLANVGDAVDILAYYAYLDPGIPGNCPDFGQNRVNPGRTPAASVTGAPSTTPTRTPTSTPGPSSTGQATPTRTATPTPTNTPLPATPTPVPSVVQGPNCILFSPSQVQIPDADGDVPGTNYTFYNTDDPSTVTDMDVCVNIDHPNVGDLVIVMENVDTGIQVQLLNVPVTCSGNNLRIYFDDEAAQTAASVCSNGTPAISGSYRPDDSLSAYDGLLIAGEWRIYVYDLFEGDTGSIRGTFLWWTPE